VGPFFSWARWSDSHIRSEPVNTSGKKASSQPTASPIEERLAKLDNLLKKKVITQTEYDTKRAKVLSEL
jgi:hypothetical protein